MTDVAAHMPPHSLRLTTRATAIARLMFGATGVISIVLPIASFRGALFDGTWMTPYLWVITAGAFSVGVLFLLGALFPDNSEITIGGGTIHLKRGNPFLRRTKTLSAQEIAQLNLSTKLADGHDSYSAELLLTNGRRYASPDYGQAEPARDLVSLLRTALGR